MAKSKKGKAAETPLMKQYYEVKEKHPEAILLFRVGDFYETFEDDAVRAAEILGITLTRRANGSASYVELAGFPYHALDTYLPKLVRAGQRVAICEQLEDPKLTKKIVKRGVTELVTPGVSLNDNILSQRENNFLASLHVGKNTIGLSAIDISTGEFYVTQGRETYIDKTLQTLKPKEILFEKGKEKKLGNIVGQGFYTYKLDDWIFTDEAANDRLLKQFGTASLKGFGIGDMPAGIVAAGAILHYLDITQHEKLEHVIKISRLDEDSFVWLDRFTIRNLELFDPLHEEGKTLVDILDKTQSPMGSRLLKRWLAMPLKDEEQIKMRHQRVQYLCDNNDLSLQLSEEVKKIGDLERIVSKIATGRISPREVLQLGKGLLSVGTIVRISKESTSEELSPFANQLNDCDQIRLRIEKEVMQDAPVQLSKGGVINVGVSKDLDEYRSLLSSGKEYLLNLQKRESESTGITSLKIGYNNVFGYYIEVRNTHKDKVPEAWIRKQTLVSAERYITEELKEYETKILSAEDKISEIETDLYNKLISSISEYLEVIQLNAGIIAQLDCLLSFANVALENGYVKPEINNGLIIDIKDGRHPVIEQQLPIDEEYVPNDVLLDSAGQQIMIITGPNMVGKSALLRQTALIVIMAQAGCFVPASAANLGIIDKVFTRVGASDNISGGESTFMVEMNEAASILNNISERSLILLDEIGRGTSTYDGISIAWAIVEYLHEHPIAKAKTLFATHYHELNEMESSFGRIKNYNVSVKELKNKVIFIRKLEPGGTEHSFGIHVARMAGMPRSVVKRAGEILKELENNSGGSVPGKAVNEIAQNREGYQLSFFQLDDPVLKQIRDEITNMDVNNLTPIEALNKLNEIKRLSGL